jgi:putative component of membrane protein insertase Oxa1/YidC/SpoIIIJ protein YidD
MLRIAAMRTINAYQRYISPYKGYRCAYGAVWGGQSCSRYAQRAIARAGLRRGLLLLHRRLHVCAHAAILSAQSTAKEDADSVFGSCNPAVQAGKELCCGSIIGGLGQMGGSGK